MISVIALDGDAVTRQVKNVFGDPGFADWHPTEQQSEVLSPELIISADCIPCIKEFIVGKTLRSCYTLKF